VPVWREMSRDCHFSMTSGWINHDSGENRPMITRESSTGETALLPGVHDLGTILVVEDDPRMQQVLQRMFSAEQYEVIKAEDGRTAQELFRTKKPIAVVLDLILPNVSGRELGQRFKSNSPETPGIVVSALPEAV